MMRLAVFASGRGSNFRAIVDHYKMQILRDVQISLLVTNDISAPAIDIAKENSIPYIFIQGITGRKFTSKNGRERARNEFDEQAVNLLNQYGIDLVALAGFMQVLGPVLVESYRWKIMNIHPAKDLARFGGRGMFGERVHAAVIQAGEKESGCTIHYVDNSVDGGPVIIQSIVPVEPADTPTSLGHRVLVQEHRTYAKAIQLHADGRISVIDHKVVIDRSGDWEGQWNHRQERFVRQQMLVSTT